jgi:TRAP-type mannitol/chloroaromatic compound transport system substrate-binding protein
MTRKEGKMKKKLIFELIILALFTSVILAGPTFAAEPVVTWKVYIPFHEGLWHHKTAQIWADDVFKMSGGRMEIDLIGPIGAEYPVDIFSTVQKGIGDAGYTSPVFVVPKFPAAMLFAGSPAFFDLMGYFTWMHAYGGKELLQETYGNALKVFPAGLFWAKVGGWGNKKIENLSDFKGQRYRPTVPTWGKILSEAGASMVMVPLGTDVIFFFERGTLDAAESLTPWTDMLIGFHKFRQYCYFPGLQQIAGFFELLINNRKWEALPSDLKEIVKGACDAAMTRSLTNWLLDDTKAINLLKDQGKVTVVKYPKEMQQEILDKFVAQYDGVKDPMFQKVWKSQKEFMKIYVPYMKLQQVDAEVKLK